MPRHIKKVELGRDGRYRVTVSLDKWTADILQQLLARPWPGIGSMNAARLIRIAIRDLGGKNGIYR
jgi:hypothetical protein